MRQRLGVLRLQAEVDGQNDRRQQCRSVNPDGPEQRLDGGEDHEGDETVAEVPQRREQGREQRGQREAARVEQRRGAGDESAAGERAEDRSEAGAKEPQRADGDEGRQHREKQAGAAQAAQERQRTLVLRVRQRQDERDERGRDGERGRHGSAAGRVGRQQHHEQKRHHPERGRKRDVEPLQKRPAGQREHEREQTHDQPCEAPREHALYRLQLRKRRQAAQRPAERLDGPRQDQSLRITASTRPTIATSSA